MGEKAKIVDTSTHDGLENLIAQLGTESDKRHASKFVNNKRLSIDGNQDELNALYRTDWIAGKVVDIIPNDMTRSWRSFSGDVDPEIVRGIETEEARLNLRGAFNTAHKWARLYGSAFIIMSIDDNQEPDKPLNVNSIKKGSLRHIKVVDRHRLNHADQQPVADPLNENYGYPKYYRFNETSVKIHHSRVLRFDGVQLPFDEFRRNNYFSDSVLDRLYDALTNVTTVTHSAASMIYETNVDVMKIKGLMGYLQSADGETLIRKRFALSKLLKSFNNTLLLDAEESFETKNNTFAGLPELLDRYMQIVSAASDIPATRLLGTSANGLNATGEGDLKNYYDKIGADQITEYKPKLDYFDPLMFKSLGIDSSTTEYQFNSLYQMTPKQRSEIEFSNAQRDAIYLDREIIKDSVISKELRQEGVYTNITDDHVEELEDFENDPDGA